jgi:hypothetical protein
MNPGFVFPKAIAMCHPTHQLGYVATLEHSQELATSLSGRGFSFGRVSRSKLSNYNKAESR